MNDDNNPYHAPPVTQKAEPRSRSYGGTRYSLPTWVFSILAIYSLGMLAFLFFIADGGVFNGNWTLYHWRDALVLLVIGVLLLWMSFYLIRRDQKRNQYP